MAAEKHFPEDIALAVELVAGGDDPGRIVDALARTEHNGRLPAVAAALVTVGHSLAQALAAAEGRSTNQMTDEIRAHLARALA